MVVSESAVPLPSPVAPVPRRACEGACAAGNFGKARDFKGQVREEEEGNNGGHDEDKHEGENEDLEEECDTLEQEKPGVPLLKGWLDVAWPPSVAPGRVKFSHRLCFEGPQSKHLRRLTYTFTVLNNFYRFLIQLQALQRPLLLQAQHLTMLQQGEVGETPARLQRQTQA